MARMRISENIILSQIAESEIRKRLSGFSHVKKYDVDVVGLDFHCELLRDGSPSGTYYYVQAKGTRHFDEKWGYSFKVASVENWLRRPFPVFVVVYDEKDEDCYWKSIEDDRYALRGKTLETNRKIIYIQMDKSNTLEEKGDNQAFVKKIGEDLASVMSFWGYPHFRGAGYLRRLPNPPRNILELSRTKEGIRASIYSLVVYYMQGNNLEDAYLLCDFLTRFDPSHFNHFAWFGEINRILRRNEVAKRSYESALRICLKDEKWQKMEKESGKIIAYLRRQTERLDQSKK